METVSHSPNPEATAPPARQSAAWGSVPAVDDVDRIVAIADPVIRNLRVTQAYCELSRAITGTVTNWCTYATWASKQAGVTIRQEDLARTLERLLQHAFEVWEAIDRVAMSLVQLDRHRHAAALRPSIRQLLDPRVIFERTSAAVSRGNTKVFAEIGREFARFIATFWDEAVFDADRIARFWDALRPGEPPDGQDYLKRALTHVYQARFESRPKAKAELILLATLEIGVHEQTRLQPEIAAALEAAILDPAELKSSLLAVFLPRPGPLMRLRLWLHRLLPWKSPLDRAAPQLAGQLRLIARRATTDCLMKLWLPPDLILRLGRDLPVDFPETLRQLSHPRLLALLARIDPTLDSVQQSGADDWADFDDRMHFIADLFRAYAAYAQLFDPAFTPDQVLEIKAGRKPVGRL